MGKTFGVIVLFYGICALAVSCVSQRYTSFTYTVQVPVAQYDVSWSRAHAYLGMLYVSQTSYPKQNGEIEIEYFPSPIYSNEYVLTCGNYFVSRERTEDKIIIRITRHASVEIEDTFDNKVVLTPWSKTRLNSTKVKISDMIDYIKTGNPDMIKDKPIPDLNK